MEKAKHKRSLEKAHQHFKLILCGFILFSILAIFFPLSYTLEHLGIIPIQLRAVVSLAWIPFAIRYHYHNTLRSEHYFLIILCILASACLWLVVAPCSVDFFPVFRDFVNSPFKYYFGCARVMWAGPLF